MGFMWKIGFTEASQLARPKMSQTSKMNASDSLFCNPKKVLRFPNFCFNKIDIVDMLYFVTMFVLCIETDFISPVPISYVKKITQLIGTGEIKSLASCSDAMK